MELNTEMKKKLISLEKKVLKKSIELTMALGELGRMASKILNKDVVADICNGEEIEFREVDQEGVADSNSFIYMRDIINKIKD